MNEQKKLRIGIANSVAAANEFSWRDTIDFANKTNIDLVQLYISSINVMKDLSELNRLPGENDFEYILHLPPDFPDQHVIDIVTHNLKKAKIFIQHEQYLDTSTLNWFRKNPQYILGLENDYPDDQNHYAAFLQKLAEQNVNFIPVFDIPRFFHQFSDNLSLEKLKEDINGILQIISGISDHLIIHLIDSDGRQDDKKNWRALFEGNLPLRRIIHKILSKFLNVKIILEYETKRMTMDSLENLSLFLRSGHPGITAW